ncbi:unnamed protein product [Rangifer tarandus platyrhynchus]|uniref:Uncharacterized protein n=1 Tax=Rangifer tarandus platyrhynchus TaxID=3082113 RepID=A0ABN8ZY90_RANTA|nr:unnamed protein product [Rangifer tarandus platyrhynchus]
MCTTVGVDFGVGPTTVQTLHWSWRLGPVTDKNLSGLRNACAWHRGEATVGSGRVPAWGSSQVIRLSPAPPKAAIRSHAMVPFGGSGGSFLPPASPQGNFLGTFRLVKSFWIMNGSAGRGRG